MKMHKCSARIAIGGDKRTVVTRGNTVRNWASFPELEILRKIHGPHSVTKVTVVGEVDSDPVKEKARLVAVYGADKVEAVYPGFAPVMIMTDPTHKAEAPARKQVRRAKKTVPTTPEPVETETEGLYADLP